MSMAICRLTRMIKDSNCHDTMKTTIENVSVEVLFGYNDTKFYELKIGSHDVRLTHAEFVRLCLVLKSIVQMEDDTKMVGMRNEKAKNYDC